MRPSGFVVLPLLALFGCSACGESPTSPSDAEAGPPHTVTFASQVTPGGTASRTFQAGGPGTVTVTLDSTSPAGVVLHIGIGIPTPSIRGGCSLSRAVTTGAGTEPQLQMAVDGAEYCVQVAEPGLVTRSTGFSITLVHP